MHPVVVSFVKFDLYNGAGVCSIICMAGFSVFTANCTSSGTRCSGWPAGGRAFAVTRPYSSCCSGLSRSPGMYAHNSPAPPRQRHGSRHIAQLTVASRREHGLCKQTGCAWVPATAAGVVILLLAAACLHRRAAAAGGGRMLHPLPAAASPAPPQQPADPPPGLLLQMWERICNHCARLTIQQPEYGRPSRTVRGQGFSRASRYNLVL